MTGPACIVRRRIATPQAHRTAATLIIAASTYNAGRSTPCPPTFICTAKATPVRNVAVTSQRQSAAAAYPITIPVRCGAARSRRRAKPVSKSRAIPNPVKTPPNAADCSSTKTNWNAVYPWA